MTDDQALRDMAQAVLGYRNSTVTRQGDDVKRLTAQVARLQHVLMKIVVKRSAAVDAVRLALHVQHVAETLDTHATDIFIDARDALREEFGMEYRGRAFVPVERKGG